MLGSLGWTHARMLWLSCNCPGSDDYIVYRSPVYHDLRTVTRCFFRFQHRFSLIFLPRSVSVPVDQVFRSFAQVGVPAFSSVTYY